MFVQMLQGHAPDAAAIRSSLDQWVSEVVPGAKGYLGSTSGVTEDGTALSIARYESAEAAHANAERAEFHRWWSDTKSAFSERPTVRETEDVLVNLVGDPDTAGFVQVMQGQVSDPARAREIMQSVIDRLNAMRPDIVGRLIAEFGGGAYVQVCYFTSEEAARQGESTMSPPPEVVAAVTEMRQLTGRPDFYDLKEPWLTSP